jgi:hypothetical protein
MNNEAAMKFLDERARIPGVVYEMIRPAIMHLLETMARRKHLHIVVMNPRIKPWDGFKLEQSILVEFSIGDPSEWEYDYKKFARSKTEQAWRDQRPNLITQMLAPATLRSGDTFYFGSFEYYGVYVGCSGIESHFDMMIAGWYAVGFQQTMQHLIQKYREENPNEDFLP